MQHEHLGRVSATFVLLLCASVSLCLFFSPIAQGAPLALPDGGLLCHPRPAEGDSLPVLAEHATLMVNGHLGRARRVTLNGRALRTTPDGRFADVVPWPANRLLRFRLEGDGPALDWELRLAEPPPVPVPQFEVDQRVGYYSEPCLVRLDGTPLSTAPDASYWIFPQAGAEAVADRWQQGWLRLPLAPGLAAWTPEKHTTRLRTVIEHQLHLVGPAIHSRRLENGDLELSLPITGEAAPLWREEAGPSGADWRLILEHTTSRLDWIELDAAGGLRQLDWEPLPGDELELRADLAPGAFQGHTLRWEPGRLLLTLVRRVHDLKGARILLDAGHGGSESGCIGASGTEEKELALTLARELKAELERAGAQVRLTRGSDSTLSLGARVALAAAWPADLLLSLHYNSVGEDQDPWSADGLMVFSWSPWSAGPARLLHDALVRRLPLRDRGLHWRSLGVCRHQGCPALLLEAGSLVHPEEEALLLDPSFRKRQVKAIRRGLEAWFRGARSSETTNGHE